MLGFLQFGSTSAVWNSAADPVGGDVGSDADPETVGWGSTTVGTLLRSKVLYLRDYLSELPRIQMLSLFPLLFFAFAGQRFRGMVVVQSG